MNEFANYLAGLKEMVSSLCRGTLPEPFMEISEVMTDEKEGYSQHGVGVLKQFFAKYLQR